MRARAPAATCEAADHRASRNAAGSIDHPTVGTGVTNATRPSAIFFQKAKSI
jgi:hypothetical protein